VSGVCSILENFMLVNIKAVNKIGDDSFSWKLKFVYKVIVKDAAKPIFCCNQYQKREEEK